MQQGIQRFTFKKSERLSSKKDIATLFEKGKSIRNDSLRVKYRITTFDSPFPARVLIAVPKRLFKKANQRNRIKRMLKELYRLNKHILYAVLIENNAQIDLLLQYQLKEKPGFILLKTAMLETLDALEKRIKKPSQ